MLYHGYATPKRSDHYVLDIWTFGSLDKKEIFQNGGKFFVGLYSPFIKDWSQDDVALCGACMVGIAIWQFSSLVVRWRY